MEALLKQIQPDIVLLLVFAALLFWTLLLTSLSAKLNEYFRDNLNKSLDIHTMLGTYLTISYTVFAGYVSLRKQVLPDFPWVVALLILGLLGLVKITEALAIWRGGPPPPPEQPKP